MDKEIRALRDKIVGALNEAPFPLEVKRLIVGEVYRGICDAVEISINSPTENKEEQNE